MLISQMDKLSHWSLKLQQKAPHLTGLGMQRQRANSRIRSERGTRCSRGTPGRPPASLWGSRSPSSPRRRSSRRQVKGAGEEGREMKVQQKATESTALSSVFPRGRWSGNRSWGEMTWEGGGKEEVQNEKVGNESEGNPESILWNKLIIGKKEIQKWKIINKMINK